MTLHFSQSLELFYIKPDHEGSKGSKNVHSIHASQLSLHNVPTHTQTNVHQHLHSHTHIHMSMTLTFILTKEKGGNGGRRKRRLTGPVPGILVELHNLLRALLTFLDSSSL